MKICLAVVLVAGIALGQTTESKHHKHKSAKHDVGSGAGDIGKGVGKGAGSAAKTAGKTAADVATLHPINAATDLGKGAVVTGGHVGAGAVKGTGKILKGTGKAIKHIF